MQDFNTNIFALLDNDKRVVILKDKLVDTCNAMARWIATKMQFKKLVVAYFMPGINYAIREVKSMVVDDEIKYDDLFKLELKNGSIILDGLYAFNKEDIKPDIIVFDGIQDCEKMRDMYWQLDTLLCDEDIRVVFIGYGDYYGTSNYECNHIFADIYWSGRDRFDNKYSRIRVVSENENHTLLIDKASIG